MAFLHRSPLALALLFAAAACGGGSSGGGEEPPTENSPPTMNVPTLVSGSGSSFSFTSAIGGLDTLIFTASDPDQDPLHWQLAAIGDPATVGVTIPLGVVGTTFPLEVAAVTLPAACAFVLYVEDTHGAAAAIDLQIVRTGPPTITAVTPASAFQGRPQKVTITGDAFSLGGTANTSAHFGGLLAAGINVANETTLTCTTPTAIGLGPLMVSVSNSHGTSQLPGTAFTGYSFPPQFPANDQMLDNGAGSALATAAAGEFLHATWLEAGLVVHRASSDGGTTWSAAQTLSGSETPSEPQAAVDGDHVTVLWIGDGTALHARSSTDGGATFAAAIVLNPMAGTTPAERPRLGVSGARAHAVWLAGDPALGMARLTAASSADAGATWSSPTTVDDGGANQAAHVLACEGATAWLAFTDFRQGAGVSGTYTSRTINGGSTWSAADRRSPEGTSTSDPRLCADGDHLHLTWIRGAALDYVRSDSAGASWTTQAIELNDTTIQVATQADLACEGPYVFAAYVAGGSAVWCSRITALGALPDRVQVSTAAVNVGAPRVYQQGNYVTVAWRSDEVGTGQARIVVALSTDLGQIYAAPNGFGNGTGAQELPHLHVDGARTTLFWLDHRGPTPSHHVTRNDG